MPRLYVILDAGLVHGSVLEFAEQLIDVGVRVLQYRDKTGTAAAMLRTSQALARMANEAGVSFFVNDRPDIAFLANATGVHVGQEDLSVEQARAIMGPQRWVGVSTHNREQFASAAASSADYIAIGPVFPTESKANPDPVVGVEMIRALRGMTQKPIVAIGGIGLDRAQEVLQAGADSVAVISDILLASDPKERARQFVRKLEAVNLAGE
ncbi:MAG TPA: thiamine phosphate synthase [Candidatus Saccharimonadales bacterium]|nr:thiamine phosphate synthase [Candidatus Saccharimonadales bacterium]